MFSYFQINISEKTWLKLSWTLDLVVAQRLIDPVNAQGLIDPVDAQGHAHFVSFIILSRFLILYIIIFSLFPFVFSGNIVNIKTRGKRIEAPQVPAPTLQITNNDSNLMKEKLLGLIASLVDFFLKKIN